MMTIREFAIKHFGFKAEPRKPDAQYVTAELFGHTTMSGVYAHGEFYPFGDRYVGRDPEAMKRTCESAAKNKNRYGSTTGNFKIIKVHYNHYL